MDKTVSCSFFKQRILNSYQRAIKALLNSDVKLYQTLSTIKLYFLFSEVKLKLNGFHLVKIINVLFQHKRHPKAVVHMCSIKKLFRKISQTSLELLVIRVLFYKVSGLELVTLSKQRVHNRCVAVNLVKFFRSFMQNNCERLLLDVKSCCGK